MQAALQLVDIDGLVERKVEQRLRDMGAPGATAMTRDLPAPSISSAPTPPPMEAFLEYLVKTNKDIPNAPPVEAFLAHLVKTNKNIPAAPTQDKYMQWLTKQAPAAPPVELYRTWIRNKAAIKIQSVFRSSVATIARYVKRTLAALSDETKSAAVGFNSSLDDIREVVTAALGTNGFQRAVINAPSDWEEGQMISAMRDCVQSPLQSPFLWLLTRPTKAERRLLALSGGVALAAEAKREVRAAMKIQKNFRGRSKRLTLMMRFSLEGLPRAAAASAASGGLDAIADLVSNALGKNVWDRAVRNAPDDWEEEQMVFAMRDCLSNPQSSSNVWLLAKPTKYEKMLMTAFSSKASAFHRSNSKFNAEL